MYRHPNNGMGPNGNRNQNNNNQNNGQGYNNAHPWYPGGYPQPSPMGPPPVPYLPTQEEQQMWHHHHHVHPTGHAVFQHEYPEFVHHHAGIPAMPHVIQVQHYVPAPQNNVQSGHPQVPSPTVTGSNSDASSPERPSSSMTASVATVVAPPRQSPQTMLGHHVHHQQPHPYQHNVQNRPPPARSPYEWIKKTSYNVQPNPGKTRTKDKYRVVYTDHQRMELEKEFTFNNKYITVRRKSELALNLGLSERQIKIWFQNRRAKERKQNKKRIEEKSHMDHIHNGYTQGMLPQLPQLQSMDLQNQQNVLSNMMNGNAAIQRYMENENPNMKMEENEEDQIG